MSFKAFEPSEAMIQAIQKRLGQGSCGSTGAGDAGSKSFALASTSSQLKAPSASMLGVPSCDSGWNRTENRSVSSGAFQLDCSFSNGQNTMTSSYTSSSFAPQLAKSSSRFDGDVVSGTGPSMSSSAGLSLGSNAPSPAKVNKVGAAVYPDSSQDKSQGKMQSLPGDSRSVDGRGGFGLINAMQDTPSDAGYYDRKRDTGQFAKDEVSSAEHATHMKAPSAPYFPSTPLSLYELPASQTCQPGSQQGCSNDENDQPAEPSEGELVYLGAGLYGRHTEQKDAPAGPRKPQKKPKERIKVLPGRVAPLPPKVVHRMPPRPAGPLQEAGGQICSMPPRSMKLEATERIAAEMREQRAASAKRARSQDSLTAPGFGSSAPGRMGQGNSAPPSSRLPPGAPVPLPNACEERERRRLENREARRQTRKPLEMSECPTGRSSQDCHTGRLSQTCQTGRLSHVSSAPSLGAFARPVPSLEMESPGPTTEDIEKQKMRLACKMEILGFYDGYRSALGKMTKDQNKKLASKLNSTDKEAVTDTVKQLNKDRQAQLDEWSQKAENQKSVQRRLKLINEFYSDTFNADAG